jgi:hypothetical protein
VFIMCRTPRDVPGVSDQVKLLSAPPRYPAAQ